MALNGKFIGRLVLAAAAASMIPYRVRLDKKSGGFCVNSLLWSVKKRPVRNVITMRSSCSPWSAARSRTPEPRFGGEARRLQFGVGA